jgi:hypothetical protein
VKIIVKDQRVLPVADAETYVGGEDNLNRLVDNEWVAPLAGKSRGMEYDRKALDLAIDRVSIEGWPESKRRKRKASGNE